MALRRPSQHVDQAAYCAVILVEGFDGDWPHFAAERFICGPGGIVERGLIVPGHVDDLTVADGFEDTVGVRNECFGAEVSRGQLYNTISRLAQAVLNGSQRCCHWW